MYKDTALEYYLQPYLEKVKTIGKPICVVDMFAGRGEFKSGEPGSPLIIANHLQALSDRGVTVRLKCYENYSSFYSHLTTVLEPFEFANASEQDCFSAISEISQIAAQNTTLLYIDPCEVSQLRMSELARLYEHVQAGSSVEVLIVFMATAFVREAARARSLTMKLEESGVLDDPLVRDSERDEREMWIGALYRDEANWYHQSREAVSVLNDIAGGDYWHSIIDDNSVDWTEKCSLVVDGYCEKLRNWFRVAEAFPIHADVGSRVPKYWMVFASRFQPAFDLFNSAACKINRLQRQNYRQPGTLFEDVAVEPEKALPVRVDRAVKEAAKSEIQIPWKSLRWRVCGGRNVGKYTESEINQSIKRLLNTGWLAGASGAKVEDEAILSPTPLLRGWEER